MAVFDKKVPKKVCLDDTEALTIVIENAQNVNGHTEYVIRVQRGPKPEKSWLVCKRYSDFVSLHSTIQGAGVSISLPPKKLIGNMDRKFVAQRQLELQNYLNAVLHNPILATSLAVKKFLDPHNYELSFQELALQHVSMALRSEVNFELVKPLGEMGWRLHKHYFLIKSKLKPKTDMLLQWIDFGPDKYLEDRELQNVLKCLVTLNHPHIESSEYVYCGDGGCFTVRELHQFGTLRDLIYGSKPKSPFLKKYGNTKHSKPLNINEISIYGRQIIETLVFLYEKGIPFGHLHLGNILIVDKNVRLLDIENHVLGLPTFYRPFIVNHKKINTMEAIDVYSLGHVLFEMTFGYPLQESVCDNIPSSCPSQLCDVLKSILSTESCKTGLPSLQQILHHPFFSRSLQDEPVKVNFKLASSLKQSLKTATNYTEKRLKSEQKVIRSQRILVKMQEVLTSDKDFSQTKLKLKEDRLSNQKQVDSLSSNGRKSARSDSLTSDSTAASAGTVTPPLPDSKVSSVGSINTCMVDGRSALLDSICAFDKSVLRHRPAAVNGSACS